MTRVYWDQKYRAEIEKRLVEQVGELEAVKRQLARYREALQVVGHGGAHTADCNDDGGECGLCAVYDCPHQEILHYHHDGCPCCDLPEKP